MTCSRCRGLMLSEYLFDLDGGVERWVTSWRCVNCGQRDDAVIQRHRRARPAKEQFTLETFMPRRADTFLQEHAGPQQAAA
ncbi:MAG: hypothetical protein NNA20_04430 [Nitrospira sp.]|nr:hypothetical protein [Nitrospira sp.]MCP9441818.1 hypothetical protein [Nitrospira sp.]